MKIRYTDDTADIRGYDMEIITALFSICWLLVLIMTLIVTSDNVREDGLAIYLLTAMGIATVGAVVFIIALCMCMAAILLVIGICGVHLG